MSFGVVEHIRELTPDEVATVKARRAAALSAARSVAVARVRGLGLLAGALLVAGAVGFWFEIGLLRFVGTISGAMLCAILLGTRGQIEKGLRAKRGPWDPPPGGWKVEETELRARRVVEASTAEGGERFLLLELGGGRWWFLAPRLLSGCEPVGTVVDLTRLAPDGPLLHVGTRGAPLPVSVRREVTWRPDGAEWRPVGHGPVAAPGWAGSA
jgi:hypothetical protein